MRSPVSEIQHKVKDLSQGLRTVSSVYVTMAAVMPTDTLCTYLGRSIVKIKTMMFLNKLSFMYFGKGTTQQVIPGKISRVNLLVLFF